MLMRLSLLMDKDHIQFRLLANLPGHRLSQPYQDLVHSLF